MPTRKIAKVNIRSYTMVIALIAIWIIMYWLSGGIFISARNLSNLFVQMAVVGIIAPGMVLVIISGNIDLSVGSLLGFLGGVAAFLQVNYRIGTSLTIIITVLLGFIIGALQGWIIAYGKVPSFIVTLGGMLVFRGALLGITNGRTISPVNESLRWLGQDYISKAAGLILLIVIAMVFLVYGIKQVKVRSKNGYMGTFTKFIPLIKSTGYILIIIIFTLVMNSYKGIPIPVLIMLAMIVLGTLLADKTVFGRSVYAIGGNKEASVYSGIKVNKTILITFMLNGCLSAIAGLVLTARLNAGTVSAGQNLEMDVIAAAVIGGASLAGGVGTVPGALLGALVMASLNNGMSIMNVDAFWQYILKGIVLVVAVYIDVLNTHKE